MLGANGSWEESHNRALLAWRPGMTTHSRMVRKTRAYAGRPAVAGSLVEAIMPGESEIRLCAPPFHTVDRDNLEWFEHFREPGQIDFAKAVIIGDFGPGIDAPIGH